MIIKRRRDFLLSCLAVVLSPLLLGSANPGGDFDERVLAAHNAERWRMGIPPLRWDPQLARSAGMWANRLASDNAFRHAPENPVDPQGENLWAGTKGYYSPEAMVDAWVREKKFFKAGTFPHNSTSGDVADVGHYTQLIWRETRRVGCAHARGPVEDVLVCRYGDAGNYIGERPI